MIRRRTGHGNVRTGGLVGVWRHGHYRRKTDREGQEGVYLDPVPIPRFYCRHCQATCSRLPGCIAPRRWYSWLVQQAVLAVLPERFFCAPSRADESARPPHDPAAGGAG